MNPFVVLAMIWIAIELRWHDNCAVPLQSIERRSNQTTAPAGISAIGDIAGASANHLKLWILQVSIPERVGWRIGYVGVVCIVSADTPPRLLRSAGRSSKEFAECDLRTGVGWGIR